MPCYQTVIYPFHFMSFSQNVSLQSQLHFSKPPKQASTDGWKVFLNSAFFLSMVKILKGRTQDKTSCF